MSSRTDPKPEPAMRFGALRPVPVVGFTATVAASSVVALGLGILFAARLGRPIQVASLGVIAWAFSVLTTPSTRRVRHCAVVALAIATACVASDSTARAQAGLDDPVSGTVNAEVRVISDPERRGRGTVAEVRWGAKRYEVWAFGRAGTVLGKTLVGDEIGIRGTAGAFDSPFDGFTSRHLVGRIDADVLWRTGRPASWWWASTNSVRLHLADGARSLSRTELALLMGFTVGDDRDLPDEVVDDFRASGLSHLTAVSGQNVVLVLGLVAPLTKRLSRHSRSALLLALLAWFGLLTRWEPSVVRAVAMAGTALLAPVPDRRGARITLLGLVVVGLLLIDPLLAWSIGFRLSVAATLGLITLAGPIERLLPGPTPVTQPIAVTSAAQIAVAPVQLATFGPVPVAALPANVAAGPVAAPLMVWGSTAGLLAGWLPDSLASLLHRPTALMARWVAFVAELGADSGLPHLGWNHLAAGLAAVIMVWLWRRTVAPAR